ncbi:hypothetical protein ACPOL_6581 [Acidisarcina polymorpha]|uniref:DinB-like domain-containing protein n=1 Tax=Acidisarcina polymorpha TaxID=2211140 RepID=A0A2Z5G9U7_9BACT|nr:hypothetical protein ACPOL_6581 [Acidisarcina polymorpha]
MKHLLRSWDEQPWSIQENIGHLLDIEPLMSGRLDDFQNKLPKLRAWEETNSDTWRANHNARSLRELMAEFHSARSTLVGVSTPSTIP